MDHDPHIYASHVAGMIGISHHAQLLLNEMGSHKLFGQVGLELQSS
jgi:hypothetical protein